jgi:hypothetical protein
MENKLNKENRQKGDITVVRISLLVHSRKKEKTGKKCSADLPQCIMEIHEELQHRFYTIFNQLIAGDQFNPLFLTS